MEEGIRLLVFSACLLSIWAFFSLGWGKDLPAGFVYLDEVIPDIKIELRYYTNENFLGTRVDGYLAPRCILTREAAEALSGVQADLRVFGLDSEPLQGQTCILTFLVQKYADMGASPGLGVKMVPSNLPFRPPPLPRS